MFLIINGNVIHIYLGYNIVVFQKQLTGNASLIKEISGKTPTFVIELTISFLTVLMDKLK
jgi:hypothetical protein